MIYISFQYDGKLIFQSPNNKRLKLTEVESSENQKKIIMERRNTYKILIFNIQFLIF